MKASIALIVGLIIGLIVGIPISYFAFVPGAPATTTFTTTVERTVTSTVTVTASPTVTPTKPPTFVGTILIGTTISEKGKYVHEGWQAKYGMLAAIEWFNRHGGVNVGGKRYKLELKYYDDESSSDRVPELMSKLIEEDKVNFILLPYSSGLTKAAAPVVEAHKVIGVSHGGASDTIFQAGYKYIVQALSPATSYLKSVVDLLKAQNDPDIKVALIYENAPFASMVALGAKEKLKAYGIPIVYEYKYEKGAQEFGSVIAEAMAKGANVLLGGGHFADGTALTQQAWQLGWKLKAIAILVAPTLPEFYEQLKNAAENVMAPAQWEIGVAYSPEAAKKKGIEWYGPTNEEFIDIFHELTAKEKGKPVDPDYHATEAAAAIIFLAKAIEEAGTLDTDAVREAMNRVHIMTCFGELKIDPQTGLQVAHQMIVVQWQNGVKKIIWPKEAAQAAPVYPAPNWWKR